MKKFKEQQLTEKVLTEVICDACGKKIKKDPWYWSIKPQKTPNDWWAIQDGPSELNVCRECFDKMRKYIFGHNKKAKITMGYTSGDQLDKLQTSREQTYGEKAVGLTFNPNNNPIVDEVKTFYAKIIDKLNNMREEIKANDTPIPRGGEKIRLLSIAITEAQTAQMWAVKAITYENS